MTDTYELDMPCDETSAKDVRDIKRSLKIEQDCLGSYLFAVAMHCDLDQNKLLEIPAYHGESLNVEVYDIVKDCFHVQGVDFLEIGSIPVSYRMSIADLPWEFDL